MRMKMRTACMIQAAIVIIVIQVFTYNLFPTCANMNDNAWERCDARKGCHFEIPDGREGDISRIE